MNSKLSIIIATGSLCSLSACATDVPIGVGPQAAAEYFRTGVKSWEKPSQKLQTKSGIKILDDNKASQTAQLSISPDDRSQDPRLKTARQFLLKDYRVRRPTYRVWSNVTDDDLVEGVLERVVNDLGGSTVDRSYSYTLSMEHAQTLKGETSSKATYVVKLQTNDGIVASYTGEVTCSGINRTPHTRYCRPSTQIVNEFAYRMLGRLNN